MHKEWWDQQKVLFVLGVAGIVFYVIAPILFSGVDNLRQPELLPIYSLMIGLGKLLNAKKRNGNKDDK